MPVPGTGYPDCKACRGKGVSSKGYECVPCAQRRERERFISDKKESKK